MNTETSPQGPLEPVVGRHTPGPWVLTYDKGSTRDVVASPDPLPICTMRQAWVTREQYAANALVVAAAPEMLAMLQELRECADYWSEYDVPVGIVERLDSVLAKALGVPPNAVLSGRGPIQFQKTRLALPTVRLNT